MTVSVVVLLNVAVTEPEIDFDFGVEMVKVPVPDPLGSVDGDTVITSVAVALRTLLLVREAVSVTDRL